VTMILASCAMRTNSAPADATANQMGFFMLGLLPF
jgi:hypothetical protein